MQVYKLSIIEYNYRNPCIKFFVRISILLRSVQEWMNKNCQQFRNEKKIK